MKDKLVGATRRKRDELEIGNTVRYRRMAMGSK